VTNEFVYTHGSVGDLCDRFAPRSIAERSMPVRHRDLSEVIEPQPDAIRVIRKLLTWIDAVDLASQRSSARPPFQTAEGEPIFPGEDVKWWLTDVQQRKKQDEVNPADEDGPASESDGAKEETEDEDPTSDDECNDTSLPASSSTQYPPQWAKPHARSDSN
jgi:hypothetical protein